MELDIVSTEKHSMIFVDLHWPTQTWFSDLISLLQGKPWTLCAHRDVLSKARGTVWLTTWPMSRNNF